MKKLLYKKKIVIGTVAAVAVLSTSATIVSCANLQSTAGTKYLGPRTTLRFYFSSPTGNSYVGQNMWFTNPDTNYALNSNLMGSEMNDSSRNPLIRPVNIGVPKQNANYNSNPADPPTVVNNGYKTMTYYKMASAASVIVTTKDGTKHIYTNDATPAPIKDADADKPPKRDVSWDSINSTPENVKDPNNASKSFTAVMKSLVTNIAISIRKDAYWSTNMGAATDVPVTPMDYWYGLQVSHLSNPGYRFAKNGGGNTNWDTQMNLNQGGQILPKGATADSWTDAFSPYNLNTDNFLEPAAGAANQFIRNNSVNLDFKDTSQAGDAMNAWTSLFINQQYFNARSVFQVQKMNKEFSNYVSPTTTTGKYGYYSYAFAGYEKLSNILFASEYACEGLYSSITVFHRAKGFGKKGQSSIGNAIADKHTIKNIVWNFSKQIDTFPATQYQKYIQGSTVNMDKYPLLSDNTKNTINDNRNTMGVHYDKNIYSQLNIRETTWSTLLPGKLSSSSSGDPYYNNGFTEAMYGESLAQTMDTQSGGSNNYFKHYYTYGTSLRSSLSSAINWYTSILNIFQGANSNWGSNFAPNMNIKGSDGNTESISPNKSSKGSKDPSESSMSNEYSYGYNGSAFTNSIKETPSDNKTQFVNHFDDQQKSSKALQFAAIQKNVKTTLDAAEQATGTKFTGDNRVMFELPVRSFGGSPSELLGLENMRKTLNSLDPRLHVVAKVKYDSKSKKTVVAHEAYDSGYTMEWATETLPRLLSLRSPTQAQYATHFYANTIPGLGGFLSDMLNFNQYGGLTGFSAMIGKATPLPTTGNTADTVKWVKGDFYNQWQLAKSNVITNTTDPIIKAALNSMDIKTFWETSSGASATGLLGKSLDGQNYSAFAKTSLTDSQRTIFNGEFKRIINNTIIASVADFQKNKTTDQIKSILAGIDTYFGRPLGYLWRKIDNQSALPVKLQKTWYNEPRPDSGVSFTADESVDL